MPDWIRRTLGRYLQKDFFRAEDEALYRNLDRLASNAKPSSVRWRKEKTLFTWTTPSICMT